MAINKIYRFSKNAAPSDTLTDADYSTDAERPIGHQVGVARNELANKLGEQTSAVSASWAQVVADNQLNDVTDAATTTALAGYMVAAINKLVSLFFGGATGPGTGKGLDADKLDGHDAAYLQNAGNLNAGTVPAARLSGEYAIDINGRVKADLASGTAHFISAGNSDVSLVRVSQQTVVSEYQLGFDWSYLGSGSGNNNILRLSAGGIPFNPVKSVDITQDGVWDFYSTPRVTGTDVWHAGNDGAASGLDADKLDGIHSTGFDAAGAATTAVSDHVALADPHSQYAEIVGQVFTGDISAPGITAEGSFTSPGIDDNATSNAITIDSDENVGIGTTNPQYKLDISTDADDSEIFDSIRLDISNEQGGAASSGLVWAPSFSGYTKQSAAIKAMSEGNFFRVGIGFFTGNTSDKSTDAVERMRIDPSGNVGVGTTNPSATLDVIGTISASGTISGDGSGLTDLDSSQIKSAYEANADTNEFSDAEETKLSNIEANATADQTKADIDALNVDADTLDGQHASAFATAAQGNTADSALQAEHRKTGQLALTQNTVLTWNHNEGAVPDHAWASLVCVTAELGYSVGDEIDQWGFYDSSEMGSPPVVKSANKVQMSLGNFPPYVVRLVADNSADYNITTRSSWRIQFHAIWYN